MANQTKSRRYQAVIQQTRCYQASLSAEDDVEAIALGNRLVNTVDLDTRTKMPGVLEFRETAYREPARLVEVVSVETLPAGEELWRVIYDADEPKQEETLNVAPEFEYMLEHGPLPSKAALRTAEQYLNSALVLLSSLPKPLADRYGVLFTQEVAQSRASGAVRALPSLIKAVQRLTQELG